MLHHRELPDRGDRVGQMLQPVTDGDTHILDTAVLQLRQHLQPELRPLTTVAGPQPENVAFTVHGDPDDHVDRLVPDLPVTDFHHDRVDEQHRIDRVEGPVAPVGHLLDHLVGDLGNGVPGDRGTVNLGEMCRDLPGRQPSCGQRQHDLVDPGQPPLTFLHDLGLEAGIGVAGHLDLHRADLGQDRLRPDPVTRVATIAADRIMLVIAEMGRHLLFQRGLQHPFGELVQQPARADQLHPLRSSLGEQLLGHLLLVHRHQRRLRHLRLPLLCCHNIDRVSHGLTPLGSQTSQFHRLPDSPGTPQSGTKAGAIKRWRAEWGGAVEGSAWSRGRHGGRRWSRLGTRGQAGGAMVVEATPDASISMAQERRHGGVACLSPMLGLARAAVAACRGDSLGDGVCGQ